MSKVVYTGPANQRNADVGAATGSAILVPGREYDLDKALADRLVSSSAHFAHVKEPKSTASKPRRKSNPKVKE